MFKIECEPNAIRDKKRYCKAFDSDFTARRQCNDARTEVAI